MKLLTLIIPALLMQATAAAQEIDIPSDMRSRLAIERAEAEHRKALEDVDKLSELTREISKRFSEAGDLRPGDLKNLGEIEKLAKRVLSHAGGTQVKRSSEPEKLTLPVAIEKLASRVESVKSAVGAETRHVVSASVIADSNEVIHLARHIRRNYSRK